MSASAVARSRVFSGYRRLFRARKILFQNDTVALQESRKAIKQEFVKQRQAPVSQLDMLLLMIDEAEDMMKHGIVQGQLNDNTGHYEVKVQPQHVEGQLLPVLEPITSATVQQLTEPEEVKVTSTKGSASN
ncbi:hypothetical protein MPSEU_000626400 [Mayamaea pseudoterrestris]|nr:hypothetical protein MPSEU_000626400 [Mayamaea pseudoterrestris]